MNTDEFKEYRIDLEEPLDKTPLLMIQNNEVILACGYLNIGIFNDLEIPCAIVSGVKNYDDMRRAIIKENPNTETISKVAKARGVKFGMSGSEALTAMIANRPTSTS